MGPSDAPLRPYRAQGKHPSYPAPNFIFFLASMVRVTERILKRGANAGQVEVGRGR